MNEAQASSRGATLRLLWWFIPAIFVFTALCQVPTQASYADEPPPAGASDEAGLAAALKRLSADPGGRVAGSLLVQPDMREPRGELA